MYPSDPPLKQMMATQIPAIIKIITALLLVRGTWGDKAQEKQECAEQLAGLATCLPYVQGQAKSPTPDCCNGLKQVLKSNKKCLCVIVKERNDPELGLQVNVSLALGLPSVCHAPADVTKCPALLHMNPNSPEAQVFYQLGKGSNSTSPAPAPIDSAPGPVPLPPSPAEGTSEGSSSSSGRTTSIQGKNEGPSNRQRWLGLEIVAHLLLISHVILI